MVLAAASVNVVPDIPKWSGCVTTVQSLPAIHHLALLLPFSQIRKYHNALVM